MRSRTATTVLPAPSDEVFAFLADVENLPRWATEFARELRLENGRYKVVNGLGEFFFRIEADPATGVIDMLTGRSEDELTLFPTRVVALPGARSAFTFTMFQGPGMSDELFEDQYRSLLREFANIEREFGR
jgi:hypothetical protein